MFLGWYNSFIMARRNLKDKSIRNIQKNQHTYHISIPIEDIKELKWRERQKVRVKRVGKRLVIEDWKP